MAYCAISNRHLRELHLFFLNDFLEGRQKYHPGESDTLMLIPPAWWGVRIVNIPPVAVSGFTSPESPRCIHPVI
jgi:hypothetical protein